MARNKIYKKDGTPTPYFWSDKDGADGKSKTVYRLADGRVTRMKGVRFDVEKKKVLKD
jgi:hypothetical protein